MASKKVKCRYCGNYPRVFVPDLGREVERGEEVLLPEQYLRGPWEVVPKGSTKKEGDKS